jgi:hypothetical protein
MRSVIDNVRSSVDCVVVGFELVSREPSALQNRDHHVVGIG